MKTEDVKKKFLESNFHSFDALNEELNALYNSVKKSRKNDYENLLFSRTQKRDLLKKLKTEEIFLMNIHDKIILSVLNISIYRAITDKNYELLYNGIYTYAHLRSLNRLHLEGFKFHEFFESLIFNENRFINENNWKEYVVKQFIENFGDQMTGKFDMELLQVLHKTISAENSVEDNFNNLLQLHSKCQWLTKGAYRECNLINYMPIFLIGIYKFIDKNIKIETKNEWLIEFIDYLNRNKNAENKLVYKFTGEIDFLNNILHKDYNSFSNEY
ncbi:MAG: hypothetical protein LBU62_01850, partial [Bacteroidales bacterium]|nr:hypothetical protein [Bacteroidales bacterium]